jgi:hypothetical protein
MIAGMLGSARVARRPRPSGVRWVDRFGGDPARRRSARIGVVGAGASGVSVARALGAQGFGQVTVLERGDRVGGKCWTVEHEGRTYELGAGGMTHRYRAVRAWTREAGITAAPKYSGLFLDPPTGGRTFRPPPLTGGGVLRTPLHLARLARALSRHRGIDDPGLDGVAPALWQPTSRFVREAGIDVAAGLAEPFFTGFGYGRYDETPALYFLKYATLFGPLAELLPEGFGGLVRAMATDLDVRLGVHIDRVERSEDGVRVHTPEQTLDFDTLVITSPLDGALDFLDATRDERDLFTRIRYNPYYAIGAEVQGFPAARWMFLPRYYARNHEGQPMFIYRRWGAEGLALFYGHHAEGDERTPLECVHDTVERCGGRVRSTPIQHHWRYFPHVGALDLEDGFYAKVEALQGQRCTYYAGEALAFGAVELCVRYGTDLVQRFFA